jgi:hypothetical protein
MRGFGDFQRAQMKRNEPRIAELFRHVRDAIDILECIPLESVSATPPPLDELERYLAAFPKLKQEKLLPTRDISDSFQNRRTAIMLKRKSNNVAFGN